MMAARASSTVRSADRPDSTASRRSSGSSAMKSPCPPRSDGRNRRDHQMLSTAAAASATMSRAYTIAASGMWKISTGAGEGTFLSLGVTLGLALERGTVGAAEGNRRCRLTMMPTATAIMPAPSTNMSTPRSLAGTSFAGAPLGLAPRKALDLRHMVAASRTPRITLSARPMATPSCRSGPFHRGAVTAPRSPASPSRISSASGTTCVQGWPCAAPGPSSGSSVSPVIPGPVVPGWRLLMASRFLT
jgi:hypothetical protein